MKDSTRQIQSLVNDRQSCPTLPSEEASEESAGKEEPGSSESSAATSSSTTWHTLFRLQWFSCFIMHNPRKTQVIDNEQNRSSWIENEILKHATEAVYVYPDPDLRSVSVSDVKTNMGSIIRKADPALNSSTARCTLDSTCLRSTCTMMPTLTRVRSRGAGSRVAASTRGHAASSREHTSSMPGTHRLLGPGRYPRMIPAVTT